jgi:ATP-dependent Clp protease ATP-binding subunit ClpC
MLYIQIVVVLVVFGLIIFAIRHNPESKSSRRSSTPTLDTYATDFTAAAIAGTIDPVIGRKEEILRLAQIVARKSKNNAILVGAPGVGKTAIVEALAARIAAGEVPETLKNKRVISLEVASLMAGTKYRGEFEQRAKKIVDEITRSNRTIILFIDEIHSVIQSEGSEGSINFADILKPALARGELQMIGATTTREYEQYIKTDSSLDRRFQPIEVDEPSSDETVTILQGIKDTFRDYHKVEFTDAALVVAATLSKTKLKNRKLPDKAIDAIDEAAAMIKVAHVPDHIPTVLLDAAAKKDPTIIELWKTLQNKDTNSLTKGHAKNTVAREKAQKDLEKYGILVVDSDDVEHVINSWYS